MISNRIGRVMIQILNILLIALFLVTMYITINILINTNKFGQYLLLIV